MKQIDKGQYIIQGTYNEETDNCLICLQPLTYPVECKKCLSRFCRDCAKRWNKKNKYCPKKCSNVNWQTESIKSLNILFTCPYKNNDCKNMSAQEFDNHFKICQKSPNPKLLKTEQEQKKEYLCKYQHKLQYMSLDKRDLIQGSICALCQVNNISRSFCPQCRESQQLYVYCCKCRSPPVTRVQCPLGHKFKTRTGMLLFTTCDYCLRGVRAVGNYCYNDDLCDYALCVQCFNSLPAQQNEPMPPQQLPQNNQINQQNIEQQIISNPISILNQFANGLLEQSQQQQQQQVDDSEQN